MPSPTSPQRERRHVGLSRADVVREATAIVNEGGGAALTMRALAARLGVATTNIYWHVGDREELIAALVDDAAGPLAHTAISGSTAEARIAALLALLWDTAVANRRVVALAHAEGYTARWAMPLELRLAAELEAANVRGAKNRDALRTLLACTSGFLVLAFRSDAPSAADQAAPNSARSAAHDAWRVLVTTQPAALRAAGLSKRTATALTEPANFKALFHATVRNLLPALLAPAKPLRST